MSSNAESKGFRKKKKKSYLHKAKKFGKSGRFGRGSYVSEDVYNYFVRVVEINNGKFDTEEDREIFISNTFDQTIDQEVLLATNQFTSFALEKLIPKAKNEPLEKFRTALASDLRPLCCDAFASHVLQSLLKTAALRIQDGTEEKSSEQDDESSWKDKHIAFILKVGKFLLNNIDEFVWNEYANHIMRTAVEISSGIVSYPKAVKDSSLNKTSSETKIEKIPKELKSHLKEYCKTIASLPQLADLTTSPLTSGLLQSLLKAAGNVGDKRVAPIAEKIIEVLMSKVKQGSLDDPSVRLLEAVLSVGSPQIFSSVRDEFFTGKLKDMACHSTSNFSVQRLLDSCPDKEQFQPILDEICSSETMETVLKAGNTGVILALGQACKRLSSGQGTFIQSLMSVLHCSSPPERQMQVAPLVLALQTHEQYEKKASSREEGMSPLCTLHGSLLFQALLNFNKPIKFVQSLLAMNPTDLIAILSDSKGSHVTDAFMKSQFVGEKSREKLCHCLKGHWIDLACNVWGSRSLDAVWNASSVKVRQNIVSELSAQLPRLKSDKHGRFVEQKFGVELFKHNAGDWADAQGKAVRAKKLFADILGEEPPSKKSKKS